jgi:hypothetical protein
MTATAAAILKSERLLHSTDGLSIYEMRCSHAATALRQWVEGRMLLSFLTFSICTGNGIFCKFYQFRTFVMWQMTKFGNTTHLWRIPSRKGGNSSQCKYEDRRRNTDVLYVYSVSAKCDWQCHLALEQIGCLHGSHSIHISVTRVHSVLLLCLRVLFHLNLHNHYRDIVIIIITKPYYRMSCPGPNLLPSSSYNFFVKCIWN